jgi:hypothetical protein
MVSRLLGRLALPSSCHAFAASWSAPLGCQIQLLCPFCQADLSPQSSSRVPYKVQCLVSWDLCSDASLSCKPINFAQEHINGALQNTGRVFPEKHINREVPSTGPNSGGGHQVHQQSACYGMSHALVRTLVILKV